MQINKNQIWIAVNENIDSITQSIKNATEAQNKEFKNTRDRLITAALQINSLFLTGWIALLSVGKLNHECFWIFNGVLIIGCGFHVSVFALIVASQWKTMRLHYDAGATLQDISLKALESAKEKRQLAATLSESDNSVEFFEKLQILEKPIIDENEKFITDYTSANKLAWCYGKWAIGMFFTSIVFTLISFLILLQS